MGSCALSLEHRQTSQVLEHRHAQACALCALFSDMEGLACHGCKVAICQAAHGFAGEAPVQQTMWTFWGTWM